jgi:hypothetical protein
VRQELTQMNQARILEQEIQDQALVIETLKHDREEQKTTIDGWVKVAEERSQWILEQQNKIQEQQDKITRLERRIAQMKGSSKIQEEILALKAKRLDTEKRIQEEVLAHEAERAQADEELKERERELKMAEQDGEEAQ